LTALLVVAYFVLTSSAFLKAVVLPRAGKAMKATVTADDIALSPFSSLRLRNLKVQTTGEAPLLHAEEVLVRYKLFSVVRGRIVVPEILLVRPEVTIVKSADGRSNLDPLMAGAESTPAPAPGKSAELVLDLQKVTIRDGALAYIDRRAGGGSQSSTITNLNLTLTELRNDGKGQIKLAADLAQANTVPGQPSDVVQAKLEGESQFQLAGDLQPKEVKGSWRLNVLQAGGNLREAAGLQAALNLDFTPTEVREVALRFQRQGQSLGEIRVNGPLMLGRQEGRLNFQVNAVGRAALNLAGAPMGLDFGNTAITASGFCDLADRGSRIVASHRERCPVLDSAGRTGHSAARSALRTAR
jgi:hypothetical protein